MLPGKWNKLKRLTNVCLASALAFGGMLPLIPGPMAHAANASDLFFSEYVEGSSNNKAVEIFNGTDREIDLSNYTVELYSNGAATATNTFNFTAGTAIASGDVFVIVNSSSGAALKAKKNAESSVTNFNGDDTLLLKKNGVVIDTIGQLGFDPGTKWADSGVETVDKTLVRKSSVVTGDNQPEDSFNPSLEWVAFPIDTFSNLGTHTMDGFTAPAVANVTANPAAGAVPAGTEVSLQTATVGASVYYSVYDGNGSALIQNVKYSTPIPITASTTIKAYAQKNSLIGAISEFAYTIAAKTDIAAVRSMTVGSNALFDGIVTYKELSGGKYNLYVQDSGAGIIVRVTNTSANIGDKITVSGSLADYFGLAQVEAADSGVQVVQMNAGAPAPQTIDSRGFAEANEGRLVKVQNITLGTSAGFSEYVVNDAFGSLMIKSDWIEPGKHYDQIVGVLTYSFDNFKLIPRSYSDIVESSFSVTPSVQPGIVAAGTAVYLSTPTTGAKVYYTIDGTTPSASSTEFQQSTPILINADTTVKAIVVNGSEVSPVQTFDYVIQKTYNGKKINEIQGAAHQSPWKGHLVTGVRGVVTHTESVNGTKRFYMQATESDQDQDASTSEAIVVISSTSVAAGDDVSVDGMVSEIKEDGYADAKDLTTTALTNATVTKVGTQTVPAPIVIGVDRIQPLSIIDNDGMQLFDPAEDALDFYESLESMRVQLNQPTVVGPYDYEIPVVVGEPTSETTPNGGVILTGQDLNPERILIKKKLTVKTGDKFNGNVIGVLGYDFSNYKVLPTGTLPEITKSSIAQETSSIDFKENELTIAGFNIENFWNNPAQTAKKNNIAEAIVSKLKTPDIIGLIEVQDNNGDEETNSSTGNNGVTDAKESYEALIQAIADKGGPAYSFTDIAPENNKDGGSPGGNIRVGYLYNPARVSLIPKASGKGDATTAVSYGADGLSYNPGRIDPINSAFVSSRKPLAAEFDFQGERVVVINNHFNSKGGDLAPYGAVQPMPATLGSEVQRHQIATVVNGFVKSVMQQNPNANVVMLGDLNDFQFSKTLEIVKGSELTNMVDSLPVNERYSYVYQGNSQTLDHILVSKRLADHAKLDIVHMNADFDTAQGRVSDHDPLLLQVHLASKPEPTENIKLQLLSVNDLHGKINDKYSEKSLNEDLDGDGTISATTFVGGMDYMAGAMKQREAANPNTFIIHGGDMVGGSPPISALFQDEPTVEIMEAMGFDVGVPGNHEFDEGTQEMLRLLNGGTHPKGTAGYDGQNFPLTVANVVYKSNGQHVLPPYIIKEVEGVKVGFVGVITEETPSIVIPAGIQDIEFTNAADAVNDAAAELKQQGVKSIIVLAHVPAVDAGDSATGDAAELAKAIDDEVDVIFAGHNHLRVNGEVDGKLIVQAWEYSKAFADVDLEINRTTGDIVSKKAEIVNNLQLIADPTVNGIIEKYNTLAAPFLNRVIGNSQVAMSKDYPGMGIGVNGDKALGNMIADGMKTEMNADFALMNGGGVRENLDAGEITWGELFSIQPFNNVLVKVEVTGADLEAILNAQLGSGSNYGPDFHVSGFKYSWYRDANNNRKVADMLLPDGSKVDKAKTYTVVVNNYMQTSTNPKNIEIGKRGKNPVTGPEDLEATVNFVRSFTTPLNYVEEGRIKEVAEPVVVEYRNDRGGSSGAVVTPPLPENPAGFTIDPADLKTETTEDGRVITKLAIKAESLVQALKETAGSEAGKKLVISLPDVKDGAQVDFPANAIIEGVAASQDMVIEIKTNEHSYELPIRVIQAEALAAELGVGAADVTISVTIEKVAEAEAQKVKEAASKSGLTMLADAVSFKITAEANGKTIEVNNFGTTYVTRTVSVHDPAGGQATAVVYDPATGQLTFVPALFEQADGKTIAIIKRNSNSIYTVVKLEKTFADLKGHWSQKDVELLASKLVVNGQTETQFAPDSDITRAEFAALLVRALGLKEDRSAAAAVRDTDGKEWFAGVLGAAVKAGLMAGFEDGTFRPNAKITREQMALMISRAMTVAGKGGGIEKLNAAAKFVDGSQISDWAMDAVARNAAVGIIEGNSMNKFEPASFATRAEAAVMLKRLLQYVEFINK